MDERPVVLVGMMGAGKTAVGRVLARLLARPFVDADDAVAARAGRSVPELFASEGEERFRDLEAEVLDELLDRRPPPVVAAGGGVVVRPGNRLALRQRATVVWLRAPVEELARRVGAGRDRPLLAGDPSAALARLCAQREPWYGEVAQVVVDTAQRAPDDLAADLAAALAATGAPSGERS